MKNRFKYIVSVFLLAVFPFTAIGLDINSHLCKMTSRHIVSLFSKSDCESKPKKHSCCSEKISKCEIEKVHDCCCKKNSCSHSDSHHSKNQSELTGNCCKNTVFHIALKDNFLSQDNHKNFSTYVNNSVLYIFPFCIQACTLKIAKPITEVVFFENPRSKIVEFIHQTSDSFPDSPFNSVN